MERTETQGALAGRPLVGARGTLVGVVPRWGSWGVAFRADLEAHAATLAELFPGRRHTLVLPKRDGVDGREEAEMIRSLYRAREATNLLLLFIVARPLLYSQYFDHFLVVGGARSAALLDPDEIHGFCRGSC